MATQLRPAGIGDVVDQVCGWLPNLRTKTMGGPLWWDTILDHDGYRIQHNAFTGHYRLLDPDNYRLCWGTRRNCLDCLSEVVGTSVEELLA